MPYEILHILESSQPDNTGIAHIIAALAKGLDPGRFRVSALFLHGPGPLVEQLQAAGVEAKSLHWRRGAKNPLGAWRFWNSVRTQPPNIVHLHLGGKSVRALARAGTHAKIVMHLHSRIVEPHGRTPAHFSARGVDAVVAVSKAVASRVVDGPARVIYTGVDIPRADRSSLPPRDGTKIILGTAGRLVALKGIECLLDAAATLRSEFPSLRLEIAGAGPEGADLEQRATCLGLTGRARFLGWIPDLGSLLPRWDAFVIPSLEEGFGIAALEAMAAGLPVVASSVGGLPELVEDGISGWLVPPGNVESLASRLRLLLSEPEQRLKMGLAGQSRARDHFSIAQMTRNFSNLYDELLGEAKK